MARKLLVRVSGVAAGLLIDFGGYTSFQLLETYRSNPARPILGQAFEDDPSRHWTHSVRTHPWFSNLLPEGRMREFLATSAGVSENRDAPLLEALGLDLVGAVTVEQAEDGTDQSSDLPISVLPGHVGESDGVRFSVAGFQLKLSMVGGKKGFTLAGKGELGSHLLKLPSAGFPHVPENEYAMMSWARSAGLNVPGVSLRPMSDLLLPSGLVFDKDNVAYVVERFDRAENRRIHMEDLNQVVGQWPEEKYKNQSYESLAAIILGVTNSQADLHEFARLTAFNIIIGNEDAHLKNFSLIYSDGRSARLAPAYDLVSTITYNSLDRGLGLSLDKSRELSAFSIDSFRRMAKRTGQDEKAFVSIVREFVERAMDTRHEFLQQLGPLRKPLEQHLESLRLTDR